MKNTYISKLIFSLFFLLILPVCSWATLADNTSNSTITNSNTQQKGEFLFIIQAEQATIAKKDDGYELTLNNIPSGVLYFSDRPLRKAGAILSSKFIDGWKKNADAFKTNPPNAAILYTQDKDKNDLSKAIVVELKNPILINNNSWKFTLRDLEGKITDGTFNHVSIFVDGGGLTQLVADGGF